MKLPVKILQSIRAFDHRLNELHYAATVWPGSSFSHRIFTTGRAEDARRCTQVAVRPREDEAMQLQAEDQPDAPAAKEGRGGGHKPERAAEEDRGERQPVSCNSVNSHEVNMLKPSNIDL